MKVSWTEGKGVDQNGPTGGSTSSATINVTDGVVLLDASYDGSEFWTTADRSNSEGKSSSYTKVDQQYNSGSNYYYGLSWKLTFTVDVSKSGNSTYDIFFDVGESKAEDTTTKKTASAFRVSMDATNDTNKTNRIIWAPLNSAGNGDESDTNGVNKTGYVSSANATTKYTTASTSAHGSICNNQTELKTLANDRVSSNTSRGDYLGTTSASSTSDNTSATLDVNVVVWFEGNDTNMITSNLANGVGSIITANMKFYARESYYYNSDIEHKK